MEITTTTLVFISVVIAFGLALGSSNIASNIFFHEAKAEEGCPGGLTGFNSSQGKCAQEEEGCPGGLTGFNSSQGKCF